MRARQITVILAIIAAAFVPVLRSQAQVVDPVEKAAEAARARYTAKMDKALSDQQKLWQRWSVAFCTGCGSPPSQTRSVTTSPLRVLAGTATILDDSRFTSLRTVRSEPRVQRAKLVRRLNRTRYASTMARSGRQRQARALRRYWHKHYAQRRPVPSLTKAQAGVRHTDGVGTPAVRSEGRRINLRRISPVQPTLPQDNGQVPGVPSVEAENRIRARDLAIQQDVF